MIFNSPSSFEVEGAVKEIEAICKKHSCWVVWEESDIWNRKISIDGVSHEKLIDCSEELEHTMEKRNGM